MNNTMIGKMGKNVWDRKIVLYIVAMLGLSALLLTMGCELEDSEYEKQLNKDTKLIKDYISSNQLNASKHSSGIYYMMLETNPSGRTLVRDSVVEFYYKVSLLGSNSVVQEISYGTDEPARTKLFNYDIIPYSIEYGFAQMRTGEKLRMFVPSGLAYGTYSTSKIPSNAVLQIDIHVTNMKSESVIDSLQSDSIADYMQSNFDTYRQYPSGLYYLETHAGTGNSPVDGDKVTFTYLRMYLDSTVTLTTGNNPVSSLIGYNYIVEGLEDGIKLMKPGGKALIVLPSRLALAQSVCVVPEVMRKPMFEDGYSVPDVLPYSIVMYSVELKSIN